MSPRPAPADPRTGVVPVATSLLVVVPDGADLRLPADARLPQPMTPEGWTAWAVALHDELVARAMSPADGDVARVASWLSVQAIGSPAVAVVEPRCGLFAELWSEAATRVGMSVTLIGVDRDGAARIPLATTGSISPTPVRLPGRRDAARQWLADRAEGTARRAVRLMQR